MGWDSGHELISSSFSTDCSWVSQSLNHIHLGYDCCFTLNKRYSILADIQNQVVLSPPIPVAPCSDLYMSLTTNRTPSHLATDQRAPKCRPGRTLHLVLETLHITRVSTTANKFDMSSNWNQYPKNTQQDILTISNPCTNSFNKIRTSHIHLKFNGPTTPHIPGS